MAWINPTGNNDASSTWTDETKAYNDNTGDYAYTSVPKNGWSGYLELTISAISCDSVRVWLNEGIANVSNFECDVYYGGAWHNIQSGEPVYGQYVTFSIGSTQTITAARIRFYSTKADANGGQCYDFDFNEVASGINTQINIGDVWKDVTGVQINIGDSWKTVTKIQINIGDVWKTIFG